MNKYNFLIFVLVFCFISLFNNTAKAQCSDDDFLDNCAELLDTYTFIKSFPHADVGNGKKSENPYVFSTGHSYVLTVCDQGSSKMVINLYDRNRKLIATNKANGKYFNKVGYNCTATGVYYIETYLDNNAKGCGVSILGFKK
jgi:hypothetical protein